MNGVKTLAILSMLAAPAAAQDGDAVELMPGCAWKDQVLAFGGKPNQQLSFRYQDCDGTYAAKVSFTLDRDNILVQSWSGTAGPAARFWPLRSEKPSAAIAAIAGPSVAPDENGRCIVHLDMVTGHYVFTPGAVYLEELLARDEPFTACGEFGDSNDSIQYWAVIDGALLAYVWVGQDTPMFDPASFKYVDTEKPGAVEQ